MEDNLPHVTLSYKQLIKTSLRVYQISFARIILLSLLMSLTIFLPRFLSILVGAEVMRNMSLIGWHRVWLGVIQIVAIIFFIGILWRMHCVLNNKREPLIEDFSVAFHKVIGVLIAGLIQTAIVILVSYALFGIPLLLHKYQLLFFDNLLGSIFTVCIFALEFFIFAYTICLFTFFIPLIAIENKNAFASLQKSILLAWNHWWRIITVQVTPWITYVILMLLVRFALNIDIHIYLVESTTHPLVPSILHMLAFALFIPWVAALLIVQLNDLEIRNRLVTTIK